MRIKCNNCNKWKNVKKETYKSMLGRFSIAKSITLGITQPHLILNKDKLRKKLSGVEMEKEFLKWYQCKDCRNAKPKLIEETKRLLDDFKNIDALDVD